MICTYGFSLVSIYDNFLFFEKLDLVFWVEILEDWGLFINLFF